jgi:adenylosuccinate synthase
MLDQDFGYFPNVTRGSTTSKNAFKLIKSIQMNPSNADVYYVTRAYATRHGNGELANEGMDTSYIKDNPLETNVLGEFQGHFRKAPLDLEALRYAISCDKTFNQCGSSSLAMTCIDQVPERIPIVIGGKIELLYPSQIGSILNIHSLNIFVSNSDQGLFVNSEKL